MCQRHAGQDAASDLEERREWWPLGPEGIIWEIQQVYKNFIGALDPHIAWEATWKVFNRVV